MTMTPEGLKKRQQRTIAGLAVGAGSAAAGTVAGTKLGALGGSVLLHKLWDKPGISASKKLAAAAIGGMAGAVGGSITGLVGGGALGYKAGVEGTRKLQNRYLEKIAKIKEKSDIRLAGEVAAGGALVSGAPSRVLGYHNVYHGTSKGTAEKIMKEGFDPSKGGTGSAGHSGQKAFINQSEGKVHVSKQKFTARFFAGYTDTAEKLRDKGSENVHARASASGTGSMFNPFSSKGKILKARISDNAWNTDFIADPHMGGNKNTAATTTKKISPSSIVGHAKNKGISQFASKSNLKKYYSSASGKMRALRGAGMGLAGAGIIGSAIYNKLNQAKK